MWKRHSVLISVTGMVRVLRTYTYTGKLLKESVFRKNQTLYCCDKPRPIKVFTDKPRVTPLNLHSFCFQEGSSPKEYHRPHFTLMFNNVLFHLIRSLTFTIITFFLSCKRVSSILFRKYLPSHRLHPTTSCLSYNYLYLFFFWKEQPPHLTRFCTLVFLSLS